MKWVIKVAVQKLLGSMPAKIADPIYHGIQERVRGIPIEVEDQRCLIKEIVLLEKEIRGNSLSALRIVELGSGWYPVIPLLLVSEFDVSVVDTFDLNHHYSRARIAAAAREIMNVVAHLRRNSVLEWTARTGCLPGSIRYHPRTRIQDISSLPEGPSDLAISRLVLPYVKPNDIREIHVSSLRWLTREALWVHMLNTSDERARDDSTLHPFDFLRYSEDQWMQISGNRYGYCNRLRLPHYRKLFESSGWTIEREQVSVLNSAMETIDRVPVHADFSGLSPELLSAAAIWFTLGRTNL